jgi:hypothetical protein
MEATSECNARYNTKYCSYVQTIEYTRYCAMYMNVIQQHIKQSNTLSVHRYTEFMSQKAR